MRIEITLKGEPVSKKNSYKIGKYGGLYKPEKITEWENDCYTQIREQNVPMLAAKYKIHYMAFLKRDKDIDNVIVSVNDVLQNAAVIDNDKNIIKIEAEKIVSKMKEPKVMIIIETI